VVSVITLPATAFTVPTGFTLAAAGSWANAFPLTTNAAKQINSPVFRFDTTSRLSVSIGFPSSPQIDTTLEPYRIFDHEEIQVGVKKRQPTVKFGGRGRAKCY
jgi:hypothetical protein